MRSAVTAPVAASRALAGAPQDRRRGRGRPSPAPLVKLAPGEAGPGMYSTGRARKSSRSPARSSSRRAARSALGVPRGLCVWGILAQPGARRPSPSAEPRLHSAQARGSEPQLPRGEPGRAAGAWPRWTGAADTAARGGAADLTALTAASPPGAPRPPSVRLSVLTLGPPAGSGRWCRRRALGLRRASRRNISPPPSDGSRRPGGPAMWSWGTRTTKHAPPPQSVPTWAASFLRQSSTPLGPGARNGVVTFLRRGCPRALLPHRQSHRNHKLRDPARGLPTPNTELTREAGAGCPAGPSQHPSVRHARYLVRTRIRVPRQPRRAAASGCPRGEGTAQMHSG